MCQPDTFHKVTSHDPSLRTVLEDDFLRNLFCCTPDLFFRLQLRVWDSRILTCFAFGGFASEWEEKGTMKTEMIRFIFPVIFFVTLQETNISPPKGTFEGDFPFSMLGYFSFLKGRFSCPGNQTLSNSPCWGMLQPEWVVRTFGLIPRLTQLVKCAQTSNPDETVRRIEICRSLDRRSNYLWRT